MLRSLLIGAVAGQRALTPLAAVSAAASRGELPEDNGAPAIIAHPIVAAGIMALAAGELAGDKMPSAPDRIVPIGLATRAVTGAIAATALAPRRQRTVAALVGATAAVVASFPGFRARIGTMTRWSQARTGFVEDALVVGSSVALVRGAKPAG